MKNNISSEKFRRFFRSVDEIGLTMEEVIRKVQENMPLLAEALGLGKMTCMFYVPPTPVEKEGKSVEVIFYASREGFEQEKETLEFHTREGGKVTFDLHALQGHEWEENVKEELFFLCEIVFVLCGRTRLSEIVDMVVAKDMSTGLANANGFVAIGNRLISQGALQQYTAMYLNIKNFKYVNGKIGYQYGDAVIRAYAAMLAENMEADEAAAHLGGDNFTLFVKKERKEKVLGILSEVILDVKYADMVRRCNISARVGVYDINEHDRMPHIMNCISAAVSAAKRNAMGDVITFNSDIMKRVAAEQEIAANLPGALKNKEFVVYYQPKVDLQTGQLCGGEALVRWMRDGNLVMPGSFIPVLERDGSICKLDFYVLEQVCRDIKNWIRQGIEPVTVSVNFSKVHIKNPEIAEMILELIDRYDIDGKYIEVELTEMSDYSDYEAFKSLVTKMKENGVLTSIDDFGTGYSSLNLLTDFMFDIVKLDKSFLDNIIRHNSKTDEIVLRNIVKMIKELDMQVIAEGVETLEQVRFLKEIGCTMVQGYLFDKPMCETDFVQRLIRREYDC